MARYPINTVFASGTTNKTIPTADSQIGQGIPLRDDIRSNLPNGLAFLEQSAIKELQNTGGLYNNNKIYNQGEYVSILSSEGGILKNSLYMCKTPNLKGNAPITGTNTGTDDVPIITAPLQEDLENWARIIPSRQGKSSITVAQEGNVVVIGGAYKDSVLGKLKIKTSGASSLCDSSFEVEFFGKASEFRIFNVYYSPAVRGSINLGVVDIAHAGFCIDISEEGEFMLWCKDLTFCTKIEFDFSDLSCAISPTYKPLDEGVFYGLFKPYAVIEGGGVLRQGLGVLIHNQREMYDSQYGENYAFYLFFNGLLRYDGPLYLSAPIFHQFLNGGFASVEADPSDRVLRNLGPNSGLSLGSTLEDAIRNIRTSWGVLIPQPGNGSGGAGNWFRSGSIALDVSSLGLPTASENRGKSFASQLYIRAF